MSKHKREAKYLFISNAIATHRHKALRPIKSFFSPVTGIPAETILTLTGDILVETSMRYTILTIVPHITVKVGVHWGKNTKGTDWVTLTRFQRNTRIIPEPAGTTSSKQLSPKAREALRAIARFAPQSSPAP